MHRKCWAIENMSTEDTQTAQEKSELVQRNKLPVLANDELPVDEVFNHAWSTVMG